ncbi:autotransporter domain-containing protein [Dongia soli]|uniref:autotransporter outer membrane beta-barrel domain-containing protein n=1 Tax=Dongia soli TaxID=600628 RepID=UPI00360936C7
MPSSFVLTPHAGLDYVHIFEESFSESGAGAFDLTTKSNDTDSLKPHIGVSLAKTFATDNSWRLTPQLDLTYRREMLDNRRDARWWRAAATSRSRVSIPRVMNSASAPASRHSSARQWTFMAAIPRNCRSVGHNFEARLRVAF